MWKCDRRWGEGRGSEAEARAMMKNTEENYYFFSRLLKLSYDETRRDLFI
jgi:hypothetical protein